MWTGSGDHFNIDKHLFNVDASSTLMWTHLIVLFWQIRWIYNIYKIYRQLCCNHVCTLNLYQCYWCRWNGFTGNICWHKWFVGWYSAANFTQNRKWQVTKTFKCIQRQFYAVFSDQICHLLSAPESQISRCRSQQEHSSNHSWLQPRPIITFGDFFPA